MGSGVWKSCQKSNTQVDLGEPVPMLLVRDMCSVCAEILHTGAYSWGFRQCFQEVEVATDITRNGEGPESGAHEAIANWS